MHEAIYAKGPEADMAARIEFCMVGNIKDQIANVTCLLYTLPLTRISLADTSNYF